MFEPGIGSAEQIEDLQEQQLDWMSLRNGIADHEDDDEFEQVEIANEPEDDEDEDPPSGPPTFRRVDWANDDDFALVLKAHFRR